MTGVKTPTRQIGSRKGDDPGRKVKAREIRQEGISEWLELKDAGESEVDTRSSLRQT